MQLAEAYIPMDRRQALIKNESLPDRTHGSVLFADISGFTPLTEALGLELGQQRGAEELTRILNEVYTALVTQVHTYHGSVLSFSGDAITCWLDKDEGLRGTACALNMQAVMQRFTSFETPGGTEVSLGIKTAVVTGPVRRFVIGDPHIQLMDALAGGTLDHVAAAEHQAERGDVIVSADIAEKFAEQLAISEWREDHDTGQRFAIVTGLTAEVAASPWPEMSQSLSEKQAQQWLWPTIYDRVQSAQGQFLAEMRLATAVFWQFTGLDYDADDKAGKKLSAYIAWVQGIIAQYEGALLQLTIGDKGSYLYAAFGAPVAHDDDPARAVAAALALRTVPAHLGFIRNIRVGVAQGQMRAGAYGSPKRQTYGVIGDKVNLSARLMGIAPIGDVRTDLEVYRRAQSRWQFDELEPTKVKGKTGLIQVYRPTGEPAVTRTRVESKMIGREAEFDQMLAALATAVGGETQVLIVEGEGGIGKSRLALELVQVIRERGIAGFWGEGQSIEQHTPYRVWREIFTSYFGLDNVADRAERRALVEAVMQASVPEQVYRLPLLNDILGLDLPETELTLAMPPELRQESLVVLLINLLRAWARERPLILMLEDAHWLDSLSWEFTVQMVRAMQTSHDPMLLLIVNRPVDAHSTAGQHMATLAAMPMTRKIVLGNLSPEETVTLVTTRLNLRAGGLPTAVADLVRTRADGNPFFAQEVVFTLRDQDFLVIEPDEAGEFNRCLVKGDLEQVATALPDTIQGLILARIDQLTLAQQLMLKVAAVIGRTFALIPLQHLYGHYASAVQTKLQAELQQLNARDLTELDSVGPPDIVYIFKHIITQEVAYQTLLFGQRKEMHQKVAAWYMDTYGEMDGQGQAVIPPSAAFVLPLLVHHYHHAEAWPQERHFARLAGEQAARQYANEEALRYFDRALELTEKGDVNGRYQLYFAREALYDLEGRREEQAQDLQALAEVAVAMDDELKKAQVALRQAHYARVMGDQAGALTAVQNGIQFATEAQSPHIESEGYYIWGNSLRQQGKYEDALDKLQRAVELAQHSQNQAVEADGLLQLGVTNFYMSQSETAVRYMEQARTIYQAKNDRRGESGCLMMLGNINTDQGNYLASQTNYNQALNLSRMIGHRMGESIILGNLGVNYAYLGGYEEARDCQQQALTISQEIGDLEGQSFAYVNLSLIYHMLDENEQVLATCEQALALQQTIHDRRNEAYTLTYKGHALAALARLDEAAAAYEQARAIRQELGEDSLVIDDLAGLARVALAMGEGEAALDQVTAVLAWIEAHGVEGVEYPMQVYLTCYQVLHELAKEEPAMLARAQAVLATAHKHLESQAEAIKDAEQRMQFLLHIPYNRAIMAAWQRNGG
ncbi:MAG: tetratricopeptide repeat protein [Ardenticatenaceae bacterium]|nr:tetratricopeptide repeat protein [Ardenticatenaceae bacterium]